MQDCHLEISNLKPVMASHISQHPDQISTTSPSYHGVLFHKNLLFVIELPGFQVVRGAWVVRFPNPLDIGSGLGERTPKKVGFQL